MAARTSLKLLALAGSAGSVEFCLKADRTSSACGPGVEVCGPVFPRPSYHLKDQRGCDENDPNGPVFDPVHGVIHHFFQDHLSKPGGGGPVYGHFVSKDWINWAQLPVAVWNGINCTAGACTGASNYDTVAIYTGSGLVIDGAGPGGVGPGIIQIYPGLCNRQNYAKCNTGTLLAYAIPADYKNDVLLERWTKPSFNPIMQDTQRDPSTPMRMPNGEWRMLTYDYMYGAASDKDVLEGRWYRLGNNWGDDEAECPSFFPLPGPTPGFEEAYTKVPKGVYVHKSSRWPSDTWRVGIYKVGADRSPGSLVAAPGFEDLYSMKKIEVGNYYASKDSEYPDANGQPRRINWGWATIDHGCQTLPRVITFNAELQQLEQAPLPELEGLRLAPAVSTKMLEIHANQPSYFSPGDGVTKQSEITLNVTLPTQATTFAVWISGPSQRHIVCQVVYAPPAPSVVNFYEVSVGCRGLSADVQTFSMTDRLRLLPRERFLSLRLFLDVVLMEVYFQDGRVAMTMPSPEVLANTTTFSVRSSGPLWVNSLAQYPMRSIWVQPDYVRSAARKYPAINTLVPNQTETTSSGRASTTTFRGRSSTTSTARPTTSTTTTTSSAAQARHALANVLFLIAAFFAVLRSDAEATLVF